jgi:hypothetical protein
MSNENQLVVNLPTMMELSADHETAFKNDRLNLLLNQPPQESWLKKHPFVNVKDDQGNTVPLTYLPIEKVEFMLTKIFQRWSVEVVDYKQIFNAVSVHVRLKVENPIDGTFIVQDGLGAAAIQVDRGESPSDLSKIKSSAVMMALPSAESYAIKDAAEKLGRIFGKDLNRHNVTSQETYNKIADKWNQ